jgi:hypothetical protein
LDIFAVPLALVEYPSQSGNEAVVGVTPGSTSD